MAAVEAKRWIIRPVTRLWIPLFILLLSPVLNFLMSLLVSEPNYLHSITGTLGMICCCSVVLPALFQYVINLPGGAWRQTRWFDHPAKRISVVRAACDLLFAFSLVISRNQLPVTRIPDDCVDCGVGCPDCFTNYSDRCVMSGVLAQLGWAGSWAYFVVLCFDLALSVHDPFKGQEFHAWYHILPVGWMSVSVAAIQLSEMRTVEPDSVYGLSIAQFCWVGARALHKPNPTFWTLTYIPCLIGSGISALCLFYAGWCRQRYFPSWRKDSTAFNLHIRCVIVFVASYTPLGSMWFLIFVYETTEELLGWLATFIVSKHAMDLLLYWFLVVVASERDTAEVGVSEPLANDSEFRESHVRPFVERMRRRREEDVPEEVETEYLVEVFQPAVAEAYAAILRDPHGRDIEQTWELLSYPLWAQLLTIWRGFEDGGAPRDAVACRSAILRTSRPGGSGGDYLHVQRADYINAVQLALFHIATRMPTAQGYNPTGGEYGKNFQTVPGFPAATFNDYGTVTFSEIHALSGIHRDEYAKSVCKLALIGHAGGTNVRMLRTHDNRYLIKQITGREKAKLTRILPHYYRHLAEHPESRISRIVGCHAVRMHRWARSIYFVVMANAHWVDGCQRPVKLQFDLKGSWLNRYSKMGVTAMCDLSATTHHPGIEGASSKCHTLKDLNYAILNANGATPHLDTETLDGWERALGPDAEFMNRMNIFDYSLLVVFTTDGRMNCCVIDYLQDYNVTKRGEMLYKKFLQLRYGRCLWDTPGYSAAWPSLYADRFVVNIFRLLKGDNPDEFAAGVKAASTKVERTSSRVELESPLLASSAPGFDAEETL